MESGLSDVASRPAGLLTATDVSSAAVGGIDPALWEPQELGESLARNYCVGGTLTLLARKAVYVILYAMPYANYI